MYEGLPLHVGDQTTSSGESTILLTSGVNIHPINSSLGLFETATVDFVTRWSTSVTGVNKIPAATPGIIKQIFELFSITIGLAAIFTNGFVLFAMIYYKHVSKKTTNLFILNQTILDLLASFGLTLHMVVNMSNLLQQTKNLTLGGSWLVCLLFGSAVIFTSPIYASQTGIIVITIERYFKIVHPISHRTYFRQWMVKLGVIIPWIMGAVIYLLPAWSSTRMSNGICMPFQFPSIQLFQAYSVITVIYLLLIPLTIFLFCYWRIIAVIRRHSQVPK
jgi:hypothetical protein